MLNLYSIFHLNLAYSSIEEDQRAEVIKKCYWPILDLVEQLDLPIGIEASGYTLEVIQQLDPLWIETLRKLLCGKKCEFIGSGYMQIIGPLVPAKVNSHNQQIGLNIYEELLSFRPELALINEQAYSAGLLQHYIDAGYRAVIMEWNNPLRFNAEWSKEFQFFPQRAVGINGESIPLIWNNAIAFQKFQRYAHGDIELDEYMSYIKQHLSDKPQNFPLYANDVEIFDHRPGRYHTEAALHKDGEWSRIKNLFETLKADKSFSLVFPSSVLNYLEMPNAGNMLRLESPEQPIPVKKQNKYSITRWAVTGRGDTFINTECFAVYKAINALENVLCLDKAEKDKLWKDLCCLWGSDFRTHITEKRFSDYLKKIEEIKFQIDLFKTKKYDNDKKNSVDISQDVYPEITPSETENLPCRKQNNMLILETEYILVKLNCKKGMALDTAIFKTVSDKPLVGTIPHGFYENIEFGADYYTGHLIVEMPGKPKVTDLDQVVPETQYSSDFIKVSGVIKTDLGKISKTICIYHQQPKISIQCDIMWTEFPFASVRAGIITLIPDSYDKDSLFYRTHNGGHKPETFYLKKREVLHDKAVSHLISLGQCLGATEGWVEVGDSKTILKITSDKGMFYSVPFLNYQKVDDTYFFRVLHSLAEIDDTRKVINASKFPSSFKIEISAKAIN